MKKVGALSKELAGMFDRRLADLPAELRRRVERHFSVFPWDDLPSPRERRIVAAQVDAQHPTNLVDKQVAKRAVSRGYKKVSVPRRNQLNAKRRRPSRQRVSDADILQVQRALESEGVKHHKQCSEAYARLVEGRVDPITSRGFRDRWNRLGLNKKGS